MAEKDTMRDAIVDAAVAIGARTSCSGTLSTLPPS